MCVMHLISPAAAFAKLQNLEWVRCEGLVVIRFATVPIQTSVSTLRVDAKPDAHWCAQRQRYHHTHTCIIIRQQYITGWTKPLLMHTDLGNSPRLHSTTNLQY